MGLLTVEVMLPRIGVMYRNITSIIKDVTSIQRSQQPSQRPYRLRHGDHNFGHAAVIKPVRRVA
jgi:hypothetical protein